jgi:hypothetical protein
MFCFFFVSVCGGHMTSLTGEFTSPGYPNTEEYMSNTRCVWTIAVPVHHRLVLTVRDFHLEGPHYYGYCHYDYLEIR